MQKSNWNTCYHKSKSPIGCYDPGQFVVQEDLEKVKLNEAESQVERESA